MGSLAGLFADNLLPIILMTGAGFALSKWLKLNPRSFSQIIFNIFLPALVFKLLLENEMPVSEMARMAVFALLLMAVTGLITWVVGRLIRLERALLAAFIISVVFMNAGNYGIPLNLFAFGEPAVAQASLFFLTQIVVINSVGIIIASLGKFTLRESLTKLLKLPSIYGLLFALLFAAMDWQLPLALDRTVDMLAGAAIPSMLVLLGLQLHTANWQSERLAVGLATGMRLLLSPVLALALTLLLNLQGPARQASILEAAMPSAILNTVLATEYDTCPSFVNTVVFISTLLSPFTITPLLALLSA